MHATIFTRLRKAALVATLGGLAGCAAAAAGAGAAAGIYLTDQGATGVVDGSLSTVEARTRAVLADMGVQVESRQVEDQDVEFTGTGNGMDVHVKLSDAGNGTTRVDASARKNMVEWDKSYARTIVERIVARE